MIGEFTVVLPFTGGKRRYARWQHMQAWWLVTTHEGFYNVTFDRLGVGCVTDAWKAYQYTTRMAYSRANSVKFSG